MTREQYLHIMEGIRSRKHGAAVVAGIGRGITYLTAVFYFLCAGGLLWNRDWRLIPFLVTPTVSFGFVSVFRARYGALRPYEIYDFIPLIPKETKGKSFPSRHVFSIFVIAAVVLWIVPVPGSLLMVLGVVLAALRVVMGLHFPRDVIAGAVIGIVCGTVGMWAWMFF